MKKIVLTSILIILTLVTNAQSSSFSSIEKMKRQAEKGNPQAEVELADYYKINGQFNDAICYYLRAANNGVAKANFMLGQLREKEIDIKYNGFWDETDQRNATNYNNQNKEYWYTLAKNQGFTNESLLSEIANKEGSKSQKNINELSIKELKNEAKINTDAQVLLADKYFEGKDVEQDYKKAYKLYMIAANNNNLRSQYMCGKMAEESLGCDFRQPYGKEIIYGIHRTDEAYEWYLKAANNNYAEAQYELGLICDGKWDSEGFNYSNYKKAFNWYLKAAENNYTQAQFIVAEDYTYGRGTKKDSDKSTYWLLKAALNDNTAALNKLNYQTLSLGQKENVKKILLGMDEKFITQSNTPKNKQELLDDEKEDLRLEKEQNKLSSSNLENSNEMRAKVDSFYHAKVKSEEQNRVNLINSLNQTATNLDRISKKIEEGNRELNAINNPTSIDAINLAAEKRLKYAAFYEAEENRAKASAGNSNSDSNTNSNTSNTNTGTASNGSNSSNGNPNSGTKSQSSNSSNGGTASNGNSNSGSKSQSSNSSKGTASNGSTTSNQNSSSGNSSNSSTGNISPIVLHTNGEEARNEEYKKQQENERIRGYEENKKNEEAIQKWKEERAQNNAEGEARDAKSKAEREAWEKANPGIGRATPR